MKRFLSISTKMIVLFIATSVIALVINVMMYVNINQVLRQIDSVYDSNVKLNQMTEDLKNVHSAMFQYLREKSSDVLREYYLSEQQFRDDLDGLETNVSDEPTILLQKNMHNIGEEYLTLAGDAVQAKRGRNIVKYNNSYKEADRLYQYLMSYMTQMTNTQFQSNSYNYTLLRQSLGYLEAISTIMMLVVILCDIVMVVLVTRRITKPLNVLAKRSNEVAGGNMSVEIPIYDSRDEVEVLSKSFNQMMESIRDYIDRHKESMRKENEMLEHELKTNALLKDAQLKYLQSQINPHFLFNSLNAGMQLAAIEDAERTAVYIENMAEFFRYNLSKINQDTELKDEIRLVENYIYILNVRFSGDIYYEKEVEEDVLHVMVPSMILQPLVENAVQYGIRDIDWEGKIRLTVECHEDVIQIHIEDNGRGMPSEKIQKIMQGEKVRDEENRKSNGIGIYNVLERLRMYYNTEDVLEIYSAGQDMGTRFTLKIPYGGGDGNV